MKKIIKVLLSFVLILPIFNLSSYQTVSAQENEEVVELDFWTFWG